MQVALYFGSFNPIHIGHQLLAEYVVENNIADEVWFVVSPCNPLKNQSDLIDEYLRLDMVMIAIKNNPLFKATDIEFTLPIPSYTIDSLRFIENQFPEHSFKLLIGSDNALVFDKWKKFDELLNEYCILVYPRRGYDFAEVENLYPQMQLLNTPYFDVSSTEIRESIAKKKDVSSWLHPSVYKFIIENELYQNL